MLIAIIRSSQLRDRPWVVSSHIPGEISDRARALVATHDLLNRLRALNPDAATPDEWETALKVANDQIHQRARHAPTSSSAARASVDADRAYFAHHGIPLPPHPGHRY